MVDVLINCKIIYDNILVEVNGMFQTNATKYDKTDNLIFLPLQHQEDGVPLGNLEESTGQLTPEFK